MLPRLVVAAAFLPLLACGLTADPGVDAGFEPPDAAAPAMPDAAHPTCDGLVCDCFGDGKTLRCRNGVVFTERPFGFNVCHHSDCTDDSPLVWNYCRTVVRRCPGGTCGVARPGYDPCDDTWGICGGDQTPKKQGDPCQTDEDCRPAVRGTGPLECFVKTAECVPTARPEPSATYLEACVIENPEAFWGYSDAILEDKASNCPLCRARWDKNPARPCLRSQCVQPCSFDDDCPSGSRCRCFEKTPFERVRACFPEGDAGIPPCSEQPDAGEEVSDAASGEQPDAGAAGW